MTSVTLPAQTGAEAEAIRRAEIALARQNSVAAQIDLQVITAVLNARGTHAEGVDALDRLQQEIEAAVSNWTDLDTPAGARAFQRYLIDKLAAIRTVLDTADLDATSKAALAAALAALYGAATPGPDAPAVLPAPPAPGPPAPGPGAPTTPTGVPEPPGLAGVSGDAEPPVIDHPVEPDPGTESAPPVAPAAAATPAPAAAMPGGGWGGGGLSSLPGLSGLGREIGPLGGRRDTQDAAGERSRESDDPAEPSADRPAEPLPADGAVVIRLPGGQTVTAPSPELAAVITAAVAGTPIPDAFRQQGIAIPPPGSVVSALVAPDQLVAGDVGVLADRHALALGEGKALLDNQIRDVAEVADVAGPGFSGWQHPPEPLPVPPAAPAPAPAPGAVPS